MKNLSKLTKISNMAKTDLKNWILWAENEVVEYNEFIADIKKELKRRK